MATSYRSNEFPMPVLQQALAASIGRGVFADTAYHLYTKRLSSSRVGKPEVVYANSLVMRAAAPSLDTQLTNDVESHSWIALETLDYGYESDSDLEDEEPEIVLAPDTTKQRVLQDTHQETSSTAPVQPLLAESSRLAVKPEPTTEELKDNLSADGGLISQLGEQEDIQDNCYTGSDEANRPRTTISPIEPQYSYCVSVVNIANVTWKCLVHYLYTGVIRFAPLKSQRLDARNSAQASFRTTHPNIPPLCSPKSAYRLAHLIGLSELKEIALHDIKLKTTKVSLCREIFSAFSSTYEDILDMQLEKLYSDVNMQQIMPCVQHELASIAQGNKPYCEKVPMKFLCKLSMTLSSNTCKSSKKVKANPDVTRTAPATQPKLPTDSSAMTASLPKEPRFSVPDTASNHYAVIMGILDAVFVPALLNESSRG